MGTIESYYFSYIYQYVGSQRINNPCSGTKLAHIKRNNRGNPQQSLSTADFLSPTYGK